MDSKVRFSLLLFTLVGFGSMTLLIKDNNIVHFDKVIIAFIQSLQTPFLTVTMTFFSFIGAGSSINFIAVVSVIFLYFFLHHRLELLLFILVLIGSHYLFRFLKEIFQRVRPDLHRLIEIGGYSFPSGHATNAITVYGILTFLLWRRIHKPMGRTLLLLFSTLMILLIGYSRIYLGVHYPSDVLAGYFAGGFWLLISIWCFQFTKEKIYERTHTKYPYI
ncbi:phosphatase PAP2 family protein [Paenisporosarcina antarctica]|uniref:Phosphatase PAP2 family protein n=1 Tax=Paenisporosarcina antarctica TaxID=417367 RepID=A0A4P7A0J8_9BACL|nr:phosphatase PAP2 family protein [Paenisporosarcina antarctica]QBP42307.1 phosphatase PAP2 family protein [Paenisporosarcina antarctica]